MRSHQPWKIFFLTELWELMYCKTHATILIIIKLSCHSIIILKRIVGFLLWKYLLTSLDYVIYHSPNNNVFHIHNFYCSQRRIYKPSSRSAKNLENKLCSELGKHVWKEPNEGFLHLGSSSLTRVFTNYVVTIPHNKDLIKIILNFTLTYLTTSMIFWSTYVNSSLQVIDNLYHNILF